MELVILPAWGDILALTSILLPSVADRLALVPKDVDVPNDRDALEPDWTVMELVCPLGCCTGEGTVCAKPEEAEKSMNEPASNVQDLFKSLTPSRISFDFSMCLCIKASTHGLLHIDFHRKNLYGLTRPERTTEQ